MVVNLLGPSKMKDSPKKLFSKRAITIVLAALLVMTAINTYLIIAGNHSAMTGNVVNYDFVLSQDGNNYRLTNMLTGYFTIQPASASSALTAALTEGKSVYLNAGTYTLTDDVYIINKQNAKIVSDGATIDGNGHKIVIYGTNYTTSQYALVSGLTLLNATVRVENSFATTITNTKFVNTTTGIEFANTDTWSEYNKVESCQFINASEGIAFRSPVGEDATGSYASSEIERCSFNIQDYAVGINVESQAEFSDSQMQDVRFWMGEYGRVNQTGLRVDGSMMQSLLFGVVFESFTTEPHNLYGVDLGETCKAAPLFDGGVSFLGNWTARIHNPFGVWIAGVGSVFDRENINVPVGLSDQYGENASIQMHPTTINTFKPKIGVNGNFQSGESITVRIRIEYIDNVVSEPITKTFTQEGSVWLTDDELMKLFPSQSIIWAVIVDAKSSAASTGASVTVSGYGTVG